MERMNPMMDMNAKDAGPKNPDRRTFIKKAALLTTMLAFDPGKVLEAIAGEEPSLSERRPDGNGEFLDRLRKGAPAAEIRLENDGDPHKGRVVNIRQLHDRPEFGPEQKQLVAEYQMEILRFLDRGKFEHVFVESLFEDLMPREKSGNEMVNVAKFVFDGGVPADPNAVQKDMLVEVGASQIYAFLNDRVTLHKTYTPEESAKIDGMVKALGYGNPESLKLMTARREELAVGEVERFLKESPGSIAALVFGAAHSFKPYFSGSVAPALYSVSFPEILGRFQAQAMSGRHSRPESVETRRRVLERELASIGSREREALSSFVADAKNDPDLQLRAIRKAKHLEDWVFQHISDADSQLEALPKLMLDQKLFMEMNGTPLRSYLLENAADKRVARMIRGMIP